MRRKLSLAAVIISPWLLSLTGIKHTFAQPNTIITGQEYLAFNQTHQAIYLRRLIAGQQNLVSACAPDLTVDELATYLSQWLRENPLNLNRPANLAFSQALTDRCQQQKTEENQESTGKPPSVEEDRSLRQSQKCFTARVLPYCEGLVDLRPAVLDEAGEKLPVSTFDSKANRAELLGGTLTTGLPSAFGEAALIPFSSLAAATESETEGNSEQPLDVPTEDPIVAEATIGFPRFEGVLNVGIFYNNIFQATSRENEFNDLFPDIILNANLFVTKEIYFNTAWRFLPVVFPPDPRRDRFFEDLTLRLGALNVNYETDSFYFGIGKGTTFFSMAFRSAPGIWGRDVAERDIRVPVRIGIATAGKFDAGSSGNYALSGGAFFLDTSVLNEPFFTSFGRPRLENGGPSNTESLESFFISLDASNFDALPGLRTHLAFMRQKVDRIKPPGSPNRLPDELIDDEYRFVVAAQWPLKVSEDITVTPLIEYARFWNASGIKNQYRDYLTTSVQLFKGNWNAALASTLWFIDNPVGNDPTNLQFQVSGGYLFDIGLGVDLGYRFLEIENEGTHAFGVWLNYLFGF